ncbi:DDT transcription factor [Phycomyces blakesleeanus NRRL 1555(-)]|uniref:DDT transcription factor n=1 Tax=Phycomyces blakesleeanus (strain ATCC 8743b / DSM 1359 / FGSC 10004 / NBRC 33097 / NRRL 1555) TaxID=763407 RepID=A0A163BBX9_PHYB8|nr:DDT transcription factor [Phycomyces blakesleeanus NRRL 1555(-)]OAD79541.1 DDT transcription factor [Phycomyces blakesleeanus NRRL 1555(-)]|eukprot:XP_018297581.1 DDT transcription factor [Phycomyces blakesleeanus NRRL 1555(-)]
MPLLKRKRYPLLQPPTVDPTKKDKERPVWYYKITNEVFEDYATYLQRLSLYKRPVWQCETTGRSNLTYEDALKSEKTERDRVQDKLPEELQQRVLERVQFQTARLDTVVEDVYSYFLERYIAGEIVNCLWDDGIVYNARILEVLPSDKQDEDESKDKGNSYKVQLIDDHLEGIDDFIKVVTKSELKRDRLSYSKNLLKNFIRRYTIKETYVGAPWLVKPGLAEKYGIESTLPQSLQEAKNNAYLKSRKRKTGTPEELTPKKPEEKPLDAKKLEAMIKYPMEDLDVPIYRRDPSGEGPIMDMSPSTSNSTKTIQNPTGGMPICPTPCRDSTIPTECFGSFLMVWCFLSIFARPLDLSPFTLDDFENALHHNSTYIKSQILIESNVALLNAIIRQQRKSKLQGVASKNLALYDEHTSRSTTPALDGQSKDSSTRGSQDGSDEEKDELVGWPAQRALSRRASLVERGCGSDEIMRIGTGWDSATIKSVNDREGWEDVLIGCINQLAPSEKVPEFDRILNSLVPRHNSTLEERQTAYVSLCLKDKIMIFELLVQTVNECAFIKEYMEECQDQLTELRKQKIELSRERKRIYAARLEYEKRTGEHSGKTNEETENDASDDDSESSDTEDDVSKAQRQFKNETIHESRQAILKRRQQEREEREAKKLKLHHRQREEARARNLELKARAEERKKIDEEERQLHRKEEQVERDMRKYSTLRIKPLGRDKFFNRYYYLDHIGGAAAHGTGRLCVQSPSETDNMLLMERDQPSMDEKLTLPCGRGGGVGFVCQLMKEQGLPEESKLLEKSLDSQPLCPNLNEWWWFYQEPEELDALLAWLNPKGIREYRLKRELEKHIYSLTAGMKKRNNEHMTAKIVDVPRRSTRSKIAPQIPSGSWLAYVNKYAK